jgi:hypothetical protein
VSVQRVRRAISSGFLVRQAPICDS